MGRIKTQLVKRIAKQLVANHHDKFTTEFSKNRELVNELAIVPSKKLRNIIAGYTTRLTRMRKK